MADSSVPPTVAPYIAYENPAKAIEWLVNTFGFTTLGLFDDGQGNVYHAELKIGDHGLIMINPANAGLRLGEPRALGAATAGTFVRVETDTEVDALHARAVAGGAEILLPPESKPHDSYEFTCQDPQGHVWTIATYRTALG
ncbi:VOC family protein [Micromonospora craniellae]|uniref:Bleomycin resistance protein n=1 Tax=Micromonospora craniellae TaxID=2294034 RepID=A0A372G0G2_9ACTN|nr:VOC family protein [Micromonospora craniellae]QOC91685.1 VOC family protein [Micromonospora craniellae]RFS46535.1 bleomycin resistance protein [Micromonospora craniellae]